MTELLVILVVGLLVLGPKRLPELARSLGRGLAEFRRASQDMRREFLDVQEGMRGDQSDDDDDSGSKSRETANASGTAADPAADPAAGASEADDATANPPRETKTTAALAKVAEKTAESTGG